MSRRNPELAVVLTEVRVCSRVEVSLNSLNMNNHNTLEQSRRGADEVQTRSRRGADEVQTRSRRGADEVQTRTSVDTFERSRLHDPVTFVLVSKSLCLWC
ncbi:hypothetical protein JOB18_020268 [Solea senegalensis]|uniref:Uncharacterized protein n=1 Tax=Solea senegalensis TaxID=28829 RepID=A0AAV6PDW9_SOLSE|nr:hypothetical protein JOB18_020268 [Solea senegalensis]